MPSFLYFDLGNVLVSFCHDRMITQLAQVAGSTQEHVRRVLTSEDSPRTSLQWGLEKGDLDEQDFHDRLAQGVGDTLPRSDAELAFNDIFDRIDASLELVTRLNSAGHRLGVLSNTNALHWSFLTDGRIPELNEAFELHVTSFAARAVKPDAEIYRHAAERAAVEPGEIFFTDDRADNVEGAREFGFDAVLFTSTAQLESDLQSRGISW